VRTLIEQHGRGTIVVLCLILGLGLALRAERALDPPATDESSRSERSVRVDSNSYLSISKSLYEDGDYGSPSFRDASDWSPGPPLLFAGVYLVTGGVHDGAARLVLALLGTIGIAVVYLLGRRLGGPAVGLVAAGLVAVYPAFIYSTGLLLSEPVAILLLPATVLAMLWADERDSLWAWALPGALLGLTAVFRPEYLVFGPVLALIVLLRRRDPDDWRPGVAAAGILLASFALLILPWTIRNYVVLDRVVPISTGGGKALFIGTFLPGDGDHFQTKEVLFRRFHPDTALSSEEIERKPMTPLLDRIAAEYPRRSRDAALARAGRENLRQYIDEPLDYGAMLARKVARMWRDGAVGMDGSGWRAVQLVLVGLGLAGLLLVALSRPWDALVIGIFIAGVTLIGAILLASTRRNEILMPLVLTLAALALVQGFQAASDRAGPR
jgi:4-amino-4-deoxy-L-arabinose transferase-like glycosyltransferase